MLQAGKSPVHFFLLSYAVIFLFYIGHRNFFFKSVAVMQFIIICDKHGLYIRQAVDEFHAFVQSQCKAGGAQSVPIHGFIGNNGDGHQMVVIGIPRSRI